jgi:hypothetical protein
VPSPHAATFRPRTTTYHIIDRELLLCVTAKSRGRLPKWVINRHSALSGSRLLHPDKQTLIGGLFTFGGDPPGKSEWRIASWEAAKGGHPGQEGGEETA